MSDEYISDEAWEQAAREYAEFEFPQLIGYNHNYRTYEMRPIVSRVDALAIQKKMDLEAQSKME